MIGNEVQLQYDVSATTPSGSQSLTLLAQVAVDVQIQIPGGSAPIVPLLVRLTDLTEDVQSCSGRLELSGLLRVPDDLSSTAESELLGGETTRYPNALLPGLIAATLTFVDGELALAAPTVAYYMMAPDTIHTAVQVFLSCHIKPATSGAASILGAVELVVLPPGNLGDVNTDGTVDIVDSVTLRRVLAGEPVP
jgi:hypothetical protein